MSDFTPPQNDPNAGGSSSFDPQSIMSGFQDAASGADPQSWFESWMNALTKPSEETYQQMIDSPSANLYTGLIWVIGAVIIQAFFAMATEIVWGQSSGTYSAVGSSIFVVICCYPFVALFTLAIDMGVTFVAHMLGTNFTTVTLPATVTWERLFYVLAAIFTPLVAVGAVFSFIPYLGGILSSLLMLAGVGYMTMAVKGIYRLEWPQAFMITGIPLFLTFCGFCASFTGI